MVDPGPPQDQHVDTDPGEPYYNIHSRRFDYREQEKQYRSELEERRANFAAPRAQALQSYNERLIEQQAHMVHETASQDAPHETSDDSAKNNKSADIDTAHPKAPINLLGDDSGS